MTFAWAPTQFTNVDVFRQYLARQTRPSWVHGATIHHTWKPVPSEWRGMASMESLGKFYRDTKKWPAGPHLFLCLGAPLRQHDGIFIGTPLDTRGVHAGVCNADRWGIEIVGNFDTAPWSPPLAELVYSVLLALASFGTFDPAAVNGHRECNSPKTCPGTAINMNAVRLEAQRRASLDIATQWGTAAPYIPYFGIPTEWKKALDAGMPWGKALTHELNLNGGIVQFFEHAIAFYVAGKTTIYRKEQP